MKKIELLAPAGDLEKLKIAVDYGADAVYFGGELFSLRAGAGNLSTDEIREGLDYCHSHGARGHLAINIFAHNQDIEPLREYLEKIKELPIDGFIVSDPGVMNLLKEIIPDAEIHLSTQANNTNYMSAKFWHSIGVKRIVLARELSFSEIRQLRQKLDEDPSTADMEIETFIHGAMCISYSGRCLLSNFMIGRDANRGACAHPCRWKYQLNSRGCSTGENLTDDEADDSLFTYAVEEEQRPGEYYPVQEDQRGTYIFNSRDLCMIEHMDEIIESGISSAKIEGRMKSIFYVANVVSAYRRAIDAYYEDPEHYSYDPKWGEYLMFPSRRLYTTGFYYNRPVSQDQNYETSQYTRDYSFTGLVLDYDESRGIATVEQRNKMVLGDQITVIGPNTDYFTQKLDYMTDEEGKSLEACPHPQQILKIRMDRPVAASFMLCKRKTDA